MSHRIGWISAVIATAALIATATAPFASEEKTPRPVAGPMIKGQPLTAAGDVVFTKEAAPGDTVWIKVHDDTRCNAIGNATHGGQGTGLAPGYSTWCWERGMYAPGRYDSCSSTTFYGGARPGCFTHYDVYTLLTNQWHLDTFLAYPLGGVEDSTPWCGEFGDTLVWKNDWGYGPTYNWSLILNLGDQADVNHFNAGTGFTIGGVHMYDCEINYDYCYLEYAVGNNPALATWFQVARFNGTSNPDPNCSGTGGANYGCAQYTGFQVAAPPANNATADLMIRWRFASDSAWDDEDASGGVHTDGAWRIDHIYVKGKNSGGTNSYYPFGDPTRTSYQNFEAGLPSEWSKPTLPQAQLGGYWSGGVWVNGVPKIVDWWHLEDDPDYANRGNTCEYSNSWMWTADDEASSQNQEDAYHYRLVTPVFECGQNNPYWDPDGQGPGVDNKWSGVAVESDEYLCIKDIVGDVTDTQVRVFDSGTRRWSQWQGDNYVSVGGCQFWNVDQIENWSQFLGTNIDSIQFSWEFLDRCDYNSSGELPCMGQHRKATYLIDNVSVGVFESRGTQFAQGATEQFSDTFARDVAMHSMFKENWELFPGDTWEQEDSLTLQVRDIDGVRGGSAPLHSSVKIHWRISTNCGQTWDKESARPQGSTLFPSVAWDEKVMNFSVPDDPEAAGTKAEFNGVYSTIITTADNGAYLAGGSLWPQGTVIEYFFTAIDSTGDRDTFPNRLSLRRNSLDLVETTPGMQHDRRDPWPWFVRVLPCPTTKRPLPAAQKHPVLLVDSFGTGRVRYDVEADPTQSQAGVASFPWIHQFYTESLTRLGLKYDVYRAGYGVSRGNAPIYSQPFDHDGYGGVVKHDGALARRYKTVIWLFGEFNALTVADSSQLELATYLDPSGVTFGDSANLWLIGSDLCEDESMTDPTWTDGNGNQTTNAAYFWTTLCGLTAVPGGCANDDGHGDAVNGYRYYLVGQAGTCLSGITKAVGYWDCPLREHPDDDATVLTATPIMKYSNDLGATKFAAARKRHPHGSKVVLSFVGLDHLANSQTRDCVVQGILGGQCFNTGIPTPKSACTINTDVDAGVPALDRMVLYANHPNPFNPSTEIRFTLPSKTRATLRVYDIAGREVRTLIDGNLPAGEHGATWLGEDQSGRPVSSGVYFYRLDAGKETATRKMVLLR